ncbi:LexA family protein, partial [Clostridium perfringens]|uniref:LexA family protein n=1 Tax=Clostridium perfringens TaxID=1502 RepID=UPI001FAA1780
KEEYAEELVPEIENTIDLEPSYEKEESFLERYLTKLTENENLSQKFIPVNVVGSVKCGSPSYACNEVTSTIALPAKYKDCYLLRAEGDSMNKLFHNGELLVCCPNKLPKHNDIVIAYIPEYEESTCKKLKQKSEIVELHPCSTKAYEIQRYDENSDLQISAVVLGSLSDILKKENIDINELEEELGNYS